MAMASPDGSSPSTDSRKRPLRSRPTGKRFECTYRGCDKFYSRAEHLERHQLNHAPKELFVCPIEGCALSFVRRDLYLRHKTRHEQQVRPHGPGNDDARDLSTARNDFDYSPEATDIVPLTSTTLPDEASVRGTDHNEALDTMATSYTTQQTMDVLPWSYATQDSLSIPADRISRDPKSSEHRNELQIGIIDGGLEDTSPSSIDEFAAWLFEGQTALHSQPSFLDLGLNPGFYTDDIGNLSMANIDPASKSSDTVLNERDTPMGKEQSPRRSSKSTAISSGKWEQLISLINGKLLDTSDDSNQAVQITSNDESNPFSIDSMQLYLNAYWQFFHRYLPILHHPTFCPNSTHNYLLMAVLIVGSEMFIRQPESVEQGMRLTRTIAWNLRGHVLLHVDASPPGRLWVFQTLLLLEMHDKLLSSTSLHERALVYFPTTLSLMRQSSTLFGRQVPKSPKLSQEPSNKQGVATAELSVGFFAPQRTSVSPPELWWEHWIVQEAIRRAAFAAFVLDTTHSVMFGHSQTLVFHEIHLFLPCDQMLWSSTSPKEIGAVEYTMYANGVKSLSFLEGLRKMFNGQSCRTNTFGWLVLLAGLLSIIGHMQQRDLLTSSLKYDLTSISTEKWQPKIIHALEWWKRQYEDSRKYLQAAPLHWQKSTLNEEHHPGGGHDHDHALIFYHLGHISIYITIPELGVIAGAAKILGRPVSPFEKRMINEKVTRWAASPGAVHSLYHAIELIRLILFRGSNSSEVQEPTSNPTADIQNDVPHYDAMHDKTPDRSWALYFATMTIWAYGYYCDGSLVPFPHQLEFPPSVNSDKRQDSLAGSLSSHTPTTPNDRSQSIPLAVGSARNQDIQGYLKAISPSSVNSPQDLNQHLQSVKDGRNKVVGLLSVVDQALAGSSWELLTEARLRLKSAANILESEAAA